MKKKSKTIKRILFYVSPYKSKLIMAIIFATLYVLLNLTAPIFIGFAIDNAIEKGRVDFVEIGNLLLIVGVTVLMCAFFQWLMNLCINTVSYFTVRDMRRDIFKKFNTVTL